MRSELKYGLISGAGLCLWITLEYLFGFHTTRPEIGAYTGLLSNLVPLTTLFLLLRAKRAAVYDGRLSLGAGIWAGVFASFVAALLVYSFLVTYSHFINPTWIDQVLEAKVAQQRAAHVSEAIIQEGITATRDAYTPGGLVLTIIVGMTLMGGLASVGLTLLVRQLPHRPA
ncbi:DUF4199 domain-containing protein [Opitutus sp. GAS368]|jgi:hypothetical protein|uniref:DUF4199 domain-containing protein n=1 Tax=Opitutus sp. GAS368 TaxID=1882749 RepID=UPI00087C2EC5|nr:DUF4199 domain-containing protein [Opitutus sp. GAS368]SDR67488.1 Protein of unknown function [Opitutus sp. GAS368]